MSVLLYGAGAVAFLAGAVMLGFGIPVHEFSFGNTLFLSGIVAMVGGLIVAGLGVVASRVQQLADGLTRGAPVRSGRAPTTIDAAGRPSVAPARIPFPPRPKAEQKSELPEPFGFEPSSDAYPNSAYDHLAPALSNPDEAPETVEDEVSLSPRHPFAPVAQPESGELSPPPSFTRRDEAPAFEPPWRAAAQPAMPKSAAPKAAPPNSSQPAVAPPRQTVFFESMWPSEPKMGEAGFDERQGLHGVKDEKAEKPAEAKFQSPFAPPLRAQPSAAPPPAAGGDMSDPAFSAHDDEPAAVAADEPRNVAILKSGVVDGMGYTLYVDGSIEAELPQGTLRFASINELRGHLERTA
jgi:hypothetical protein